MDETLTMLRVLGNPVVELRVLPDAIRGYFDDLEAAARQATKLSQAGQNVYVTINELRVQGAFAQLREFQRIQ